MAIFDLKQCWTLVIVDGEIHTELFSVWILISIELGFVIALLDTICIWSEQEDDLFLWALRTVFLDQQSGVSNKDAVYIHLRLSLHNTAYKI
jgi:hypothetical protein